MSSYSPFLYTHERGCPSLILISNLAHIQHPRRDPLFAAKTCGDFVELALACSALSYPVFGSHLAKFNYFGNLQFDHKWNLHWWNKPVTRVSSGRLISTNDTWERLRRHKPELPNFHILRQDAYVVRTTSLLSKLLQSVYPHPSPVIIFLQFNFVRFINCADYVCWVVCIYFTSEYSAQGFGLDVCPYSSAGRALYLWGYLAMQGSRVRLSIWAYLDFFWDKSNPEGKQGLQSVAVNYIGSWPSCIWNFDIQDGMSEFKSLYRAGPTPLSIKGSTIFNLP